jgi:CheY-like chemotaxis protein
MKNGSQLSVLIVEDNRDGAETLAMLLGIHGHAVQIAGDGEEALALAGNSPPHVVILDIGLPRMDGLELARKMREMLCSRALVIAVSGYADKEQACRAAGIDHYLVKPTHCDAIDAILKTYAQKLHQPPPA